MVYRNSPQKPRRYSYENNSSPKNGKNNMDETFTDLLKDSETIPAPNLVENIPLPSEKNKENRFLPSLNFLKNKITIEEIILIGLIFLILDEGIEDEFLLLMLLYILLI